MPTPFQEELDRLLDIDRQMVKVSLATRIDLAWSVYKDPEQSKDNLAKAQCFLAYAFDLSDEDLPYFNNKLMLLLEERALHKAENPEYIPGKVHPALLLDRKKLNIQPTPIEWDDEVTAIDPAIVALLKKSELLDVDSGTKLEDQENFIKYLTGEERALFRVDIHQGFFKTSNKKYDTTHLASHYKRGYVSYTFNANGELSMFVHEGGNGDYVHSTTNAAAPIVCAGEAKIKKGCLSAITTYSGHYKPTLLNIFRMLEYFSAHGMDISTTEVYLLEPPYTSFGFSVQQQRPTAEELQQLPASHLLWKETRLI